MLYSGPPCTRLQGDRDGRLSAPAGLHRYCRMAHRSDYQAAVAGPELTQADYQRVHHPAHVHEVMQAIQQDWQTAFGAAARYSVESSHAHYAGCAAALDAGFCLALAGDFGGAGYAGARFPWMLNGLLVSAARLKAEGRVRGVLILDGNATFIAATASTIDLLDLDWIKYVSLGSEEVGYDWKAAQEAAERAVTLSDASLIMYQCGTDCCGAFSPLGYMGRMEWEERHRLLASLWRRRATPWVMNVGAAGSLHSVWIDFALRHFATPSPPPSEGQKLAEVERRRRA